MGPFDWFVRLCFLAIGIILGRLSMAVQVEVMRPGKKN